MSDNVVGGHPLATLGHAIQLTGLLVSFGEHGCGSATSVVEGVVVVVVVFTHHSSTALQRHNA